MVQLIEFIQNALYIFYERFNQQTYPTPSYASYNQYPKIKSHDFRNNFILCKPVDSTKIAKFTLYLDKKNNNIISYKNTKKKTTETQYSQLYLSNIGSRPLRHQSRNEQKKKTIFIRSCCNYCSLLIAPAMMFRSARGFVG